MNRDAHLYKYKKNCIVIPIYKDTLEQYEIESIHNTLTLMYKYDIYFVCPKSININYYIDNFVNKYNRTNIYFAYFDDYYFTNINTYSLLCLSDIFYEAFFDYDYMLICQPDAWIFYDNLMYFCNQKYDYLGALVIFYGRTNTEDYHILNGGFSLRKIKRFYEVTKRDKIQINNALKNNNLNEDLYICTYLLGNFNIPINDKLDIKLISKFSIETIYDFMNLHHLPFGCHTINTKNKLTELNKIKK